MVWVLYQHIQNRTTFEQVVKFLRECFGLIVPLAQLWRFKSRLAREYKGTYRDLLNSIVSGYLIHADETSVNLKKDKGYVWVVTNLNDVYYMYKGTREGSFLHQLLDGFKGVLVSDSVKCKQKNTSFI
jgi:hypothetical protein